MVNLHKVIEQFKTVGIPTEKGLGEDRSIQDFFSIIKEKSPKAICFDMGLLDSLPSMFFKGFDQKLPFPVCWLEQGFASGMESKGFVSGPQHRRATLCYEGENNGVVGTWFYCFVTNIVNLSWSFWGVFFVHKNNEEKQKCDCFTDNRNVFETFNIWLPWIQIFLSALKCTNVEMIKKTPDQKLQKKRLKKGKQPFFSYYELHLKIPNYRKNPGENLGGSHASPRLHLRRGHIREYAPEKFCWVDPCVVGNKENGIIHKDYIKK